MAAAQATDSFGIPLKPVNADLVQERKKATFNVQELTHFIDGGPERTKRRKELGKRKHGRPCIFLVPANPGCHVVRSDSVGYARTKGCRIQSVHNINAVK